MTKLRQKMLEDLQLKGMSKRTQESYIRVVRQLAEHYWRSPAQITEQELRDYFLHMKNVKKYARPTMTIALCGIKFFYETTLQRDWTILKLVRPPREKKLPVILSIEEVFKILSNVEKLLHRVYLSTVYSCGLRLKEGTHLQVKDIDSSRNLIHVCNGKGGKDRYVPLPMRTLELLRQLWKTHRNPVWIFPAPGRGGIGMSTADEPVPTSSVQGAFRTALKKTGINKKVSVHSLRHAYATHLLENGVNLRIIQEYLGHNSPKTTAVYTHLTEKAKKNTADTLNQIMRNL